MFTLLPRRIECCEYWNALLQSAETKRAMSLYLQPLLERLVCRLVLSKEQMEHERIQVRFCSPSASRCIAYATTCQCNRGTILQEMTRYLLTITMKTILVFEIIRVALNHKHIFKLIFFIFKIDFYVDFYVDF